MSSFPKKSFRGLTDLGDRGTAFWNKKNLKTDSSSVENYGYISRKEWQLHVKRVYVLSSTAQRIWLLIENYERDKEQALDKGFSNTT